MAESKLQAFPEASSKPLRRRGPAVAEVGIRHVFVRDLVLPCNIGVHRHERDAPQRVRINLDLAVWEDDRPIDDSIGNVVCYEEVAKGVRAIVGAGHVNLVETLAERIAGFCLKDPRVKAVWARVEKLDVFPDAASVGVEIVRTRAM
jgi:dihydroneopterin aldolase